MGMSRGRYGRYGYASASTETETDGRPERDWAGEQPPQVAWRVEPPWSVANRLVLMSLPSSAHTLICSPNMSARDPFATPDPSLHPYRDNPDPYTTVSDSRRAFYIFRLPTFLTAFFLSSLFFAPTRRASAHRRSPLNVRPPSSPPIHSFISQSTHNLSPGAHSMQNLADQTTPMASAYRNVDSSLWQETRTAPSKSRSTWIVRSPLSPPHHFRDSDTPIRSQAVSSASLRSSQLALAWALPSHITIATAPRLAAAARLNPRFHRRIRMTPAPS